MYSMGCSVWNWMPRDAIEGARVMASPTGTCGLPKLGTSSCLGWKKRAPSASSSAYAPNARPGPSCAATVTTVPEGPSERTMAYVMFAASEALAMAAGLVESQIVAFCEKSGVEALTVNVPPQSCPRYLPTSELTIARLASPPVSNETATSAAENAVMPCAAAAALQATVGSGAVVAAGEPLHPPATARAARRGRARFDVKSMARVYVARTACGGARNVCLVDPEAMPFLPRALRLAVLALGLTACAPLPPAVPFSGTLPPFATGAHFVVVGDLQRTSLLEFWREQNDPERERVVAAIAADGPAFLAVTGDMVFDGSSGSQWAAFDALTTPLRAAGIPVFAAFGNHEYWGGGKGDAPFFARFPHLQGKHWFSVAWGPLRLVVLDSNAGHLGDRLWQEQKAWYQGTLEGLDRDPEVRSVLVLLHHPAMTNSTVTGDEGEVVRDLLPAFLAAKKTTAMMSGHVHSYERFGIGDKTLIVSGGGGGPRALLSTGKDRRHPGDLYGGPALRDFNFVRMTVVEKGIEVLVRGLPKGGTVFATIDRFFLPFP